MPDLLKAIWAHPPQVERWLRRMCVGSTLNVCSGLSLVGDVRLDLSPESKFTLKGDVMNLPFRKLSFDTVICDPPFSYFNRFKWILKLADLARYRFMISSPILHVQLSPKRWKRDLYYAYFGMGIRTYWVFNRKNGYVLQNQDQRLINGPLQ